jgi:hypothetical protein
MTLIVRLLTSLAMADDAVISAQRAEARQPCQRERSYPGSILPSVSGSAINKITAIMKAATHSPTGSALIGTFVVSAFSFKRKENIAFC